MARTPRSSIDETDARILQLLLNDGRKSHSEMARLLSLPETTVRNRVRRLIREGYVQIQAILNSDRWGPVVEILILVATEPSAIDSVAEAFAERPETRSVRRVIGIADLVVEAGFAGEPQLLAYMDFAAKIPGVRDLKYSNFLKMYKGQFVIPHGWNSRMVVRPWDEETGELPSDPG